jgi:hypothetical protein
VINSSIYGEMAQKNGWDLIVPKYHGGWSPLSKYSYSGDPDNIPIESQQTSTKELDVHINIHIYKWCSR